MIPGSSGMVNVVLGSGVVGGCGGVGGSCRSSGAGGSGVGEGAGGSIRSSSSSTVAGACGEVIGEFSCGVR
ncbi:Uncharacterised protein [Mycobacteroides abscessus subsp. abscessus]|nr:Uncharacterised protein [Mycobacteroides abscessus subsp. abscessus]